MREQPWLSISALAAAIAGIGLGIAALILVLDEDHQGGQERFFGPAGVAERGAEHERDRPGMIGRALEKAGVGSTWLGVAVEDTDGGVQVSTVAPGSPAEKAGINEGDVIRSIDGTAVADSAVLGDAIAAHQPGDQVQVGVERAGKPETVAVTLEARPATAAVSGGPMGPGDGMRHMLPPGVDLGDLPKRIISGELVIENAEGEKKTYRLASGSVQEVTEERLTVAPEEGDATTFAISEETIVLPRREDLTAGDQV